MSPSPSSSPSCKPCSTRRATSRSTSWTTTRCRASPSWRCATRARGAGCCCEPHLRLRMGQRRGWPLRGRDGAREEVLAVSQLGREQFCFYCGEPQGVFQWDSRLDGPVACGSVECQREARYEVRAQREEAMERAREDGYSLYG